MMTLRSWGLLGATLALMLSVALYFLVAPGRLAPTASGGMPAGPDWISAAAEISADRFERLSGSWELGLPRDHAAHPDARTEIWQMSAHLSREGGEPVGLQFLLLRLGLAGPDAPVPNSTWEARDIYRAHVILVDGNGKPAVAEERFGRGMAGLAGYDMDLNELRFDNWSVEFPPGPDQDRWRLRASAGDALIDLLLSPGKAPLPVDADAAPFRGYAFSQLKAEGRIMTQDGEDAISGVAWFDHLWGDLPIPGGSPVASDRLQLHLDDGSEVSVVRSRRIDGTGAPTLDVLLIDAEGAAVAVGDDASNVELTRHWKGIEADWPVDWRLQLGDLELVISPVTDAQEHSFMTRLWSGLVRAEGHRSNQPVSGLGTLQLTGYGN